MKWINFNEKTKLVASMLTSRLINAYRNPSLLNYRNILCIKDDEIGDMCYSLHVFKMLRNQYPEAEITVFCKPYCVPLLKSDPSVNHLLTDWKELNGSYDLIVDLKISWKGMGLALKKWPKARLDRGTVRFTDAFQRKYPHEKETNFKTVAPVIRESAKVELPAIVLGESDKIESTQFIDDHQLNQFAILHISARRELRKWPLANFCAIAEYLHNEKGLQIVFTGGPGEEKDIEAAQKKLSFASFSTVGKLSLSALAALMSKASLFIGNESGPLHIAAISQVPCLGLFGPGPKIIFYPYGKYAAFIHHVLPCNPCDQIHCVHPENPCIQRITLVEVQEKVNQLVVIG